MAFARGSRLLSPGIVAVQDQLTPRSPWLLPTTFRNFQQKRRSWTLCTGGLPFYREPKFATACELTNAMVMRDLAPCGERPFL
jgi:hypothetical protein